MILKPVFKLVKTQARFKCFQFFAAAIISSNNYTFAVMNSALLTLFSANISALCVCFFSVSQRRNSSHRITDKAINSRRFRTFLYHFSAEDVTKIKSANGLRRRVARLVNTMEDNSWIVFWSTRDSSCYTAESYTLESKFFSYA